MNKYLFLPILLLTISCKPSSKLQYNNTIEQLNGKWSSECTAPLDNPTYIDCSMEDNYEMIKVNKDTGEGTITLILGDNSKRSEKIKVYEADKKIFMDVYGRKIRKGEITKLADNQLQIKFEAEKYLSFRNRLN